jgi:hypothetical protein
MIRSPRLGEPFALLAADWPDLQLLHAFHPVAELTLGMSGIATLVNQAIVFGSELPAQFVAAALLHEHEGDDHDGQRDEHTDNDSRVE